MQPTTHYGVFKRANEGNARCTFLDHGIDSVGLRPLTVYGVNRDTVLQAILEAMKSAVLGRPFHCVSAALPIFSTSPILLPLSSPVAMTCPRAPRFQSARRNCNGRTHREFHQLAS